MRDVDYYVAGFSPREMRIHQDYKDTATMFGIDYANKVRKEVRHEESLQNARLDYPFDGMEVYHQKKYHEDCKTWLDKIDELQLPIQIESCIGKTTYHDGDFKWMSNEGRVWRFRDKETKYSLDFSPCERDVSDAERGYINGRMIHVKFLWALPEDQGNYYKMNKTLRRCAYILFSDGYDYLEGWASEINQLPVRQGRYKNWRAAKVKMKDRDRKLSNNDGIKLLALYLRCGFFIVGEKKGDKLIAYISPLLYKYMTKEDPDALQDELKYARNFSYDIKY
jgi:hypothetical protein